MPRPHQNRHHLSVGPPSRGPQGVLLTSKRKTAELFHRTRSWPSPRNPLRRFHKRYGAPPDIYSGDSNIWLWRIAIDLLWHNPGIEVIYVHTTDYPMHTWRPEEEGSLDHLSALDALLGEAKKAAPDAAFLITADHGMNAKKRCWDLTGSAPRKPYRCALPCRRSTITTSSITGTSPVRPGSAQGPGDLEAVGRFIAGLAGVEEVITREEAAARFAFPMNTSGISWSWAIGTRSSGTWKPRARPCRPATGPTVPNTSQKSRLSLTIGVPAAGAGILPIQPASY